MRIPQITRFGLFTFGLVLSIGLQSAPVLAQTGASAQAKPDVESILTSKKVSVGADKKEVLSDATTVKPGELIEYRATYTNKGKAVVTNLLATLPIPPGTEYQGSTATPKTGVKASLGDGKFEPIPLKRKVKLPDGKEVERNVPLTEYKSLQWSLGELAAGKSVVVSARVRVTDVTPAVSATPASATPPPPSSSGGQK
jgi:uncharacterized repeat protein (TIGR01451 family)